MMQLGRLFFLLISLLELFIPDHLKQAPKLANPSEFGLVVIVLAKHGRANLMNERETMKMLFRTRE